VSRKNWSQEPATSSGWSQQCSLAASISWQIPGYFSRKLGHSFGKISFAGPCLLSGNQRQVRGASFIVGRLPLLSRRSLKIHFHTPPTGQI
jgi:hypothetical protein